MTRRLLSGYLSITVLIVVLLGVPLGILFARHERENLIETVRHDASELATFAVLPLSGGTDLARLQDAVNDYATATNGRVVVVDPSGVSIVDSDGPAGVSFSSRPEVASALRGKASEGFRHSETLRTKLLFVAVPVNSGSHLLGVVRVTYPASVVESRIHRSWTTIGAVGLLVLAAVTGLSLSVARSVGTPVRALVRGAQQLGEGNLHTRVELDRGPPEIRALASSFNDTAEKLERLVTGQQAFVADASHQLRTPLTALRLRLENLQSAATTDKASADVGKALGEVTRMSRLVDGLLVLARTDAMPAATRPLDVDAIVAGRDEVWRSVAEAQKIRLIVVGHGGLALLTPDSLEQALDNLVANAIDAAPAGSTVTLGVDRNPFWVTVTVSDEGAGMTPEARAHAFTRFLSTRSETGGFGLGLAIAHRLATRDGGDLVLDEAASGGLAAQLRLRPAATIAGRDGVPVGAP